MMLVGRGATYCNCNRVKKGPWGRVAASHSSSQPPPQPWTLRQRTTRQAVGASVTGWPHIGTLPPGQEDRCKEGLGNCKIVQRRSRYGFINRKFTKEDVFVHQTTLKNTPGSTFIVWGLERQWGLDIVEGEKGVEASSTAGPGGVPAQGSK